MDSSKATEPIGFDTQPISENSRGVIALNEKKLYVSSLCENALEVLGQSLDTTGGHSLILARRPVTFDYYEIQRLVYKQKQNKDKKVFVHYEWRLNPQVQELRTKVRGAISTGSNVTSIFVDHAYTQSEGSKKITLDGIDLVLYLSQQKVDVVQGFPNGTQDDSSIDKFSLLSGKLASGATFTLNLRKQEEGPGITTVLLALSSGELLNVSISDIEKTSKNLYQNLLLAFDENNEDAYATLEEDAHVLRVYRCGIHSLKTGKTVVLKHIGKGVTPIRTIGTAAFLTKGLFIPASPNKGVAITGLYSARQERVKEIFNRIAQLGEPLEYIPDYETLFCTPHSENQRPIFYVPSLPGARKNQEIVDALKAGQTVLAEKPAFVNADIGKELLSMLDTELQKHLFFGWHYQHHFIFKKIWRDISNGVFGKIKHIRTYFSVPKILDGSRAFEPSQGGAGVDIYSYNLHFTLRLIGFNHGFEVLQSKIKSAQDLDPNNPSLANIDFVLDTKLSFSNGTTADIYATYDSERPLHTEAEIVFEDGSKMFCKHFVHFQNVVELGTKPVLTFKAGGTKWANYMTSEEMVDPQYFIPTYQQQIEFIRRQANGEEQYDAVNNDFGGLGIHANLKLHEIIDAVFEAGGFKKKGTA